MYKQCFYQCIQCEHLEMYRHWDTVVFECKQKRWDLGCLEIGEFRKIFKKNSRCYKYKSAK